jgi:hypothetical protein
MIARADADSRGVAVMPLSDSSHEISLQTAGAARIQLKALKPQPRSVDRAAALPIISRFLNANPSIEIAWLSDGVDNGNAAAFVEGLRKAVGDRPLTIVDGGLPIPHALAAADNAAGALTVKVLRAQTGTAENGLVNAMDLKGLSLGQAPVAFKSGDRERRPQPSTCRSKFATTSRASTSPASARPALCNCSTNAGVAGRSAWCPARPPTARSR